MDENNLFLDTVLERKACDKHRVPTNLPCYSFPALARNEMVWGVCNDRARRAGFVGEPDPRSLQQKG